MNFYTAKKQRLIYCNIEHDYPKIYKNTLLFVISTIY